MECRMSVSPVYHEILEFAQTHVHWVNDVTQPSHPLSSPSPDSIFPSIRVFPNESALCIRWPKYWSFSFSISPSSEYLGLISFWLVWSPCSPRDSQESSPTPQFKGISFSALSLTYGPALASIYVYRKNHSFDYMDLCWQSDVSASCYDVTNTRLKNQTYLGWT